MINFFLCLAFYSNMKSPNQLDYQFLGFLHMYCLLDTYAMLRLQIHLQHIVLCSTKSLLYFSLKIQNA